MLTNPGNLSHVMHYTEQVKGKGGIALSIDGENMPSGESFSIAFPTDRLNPQVVDQWLLAVRREYERQTSKAPSSSSGKAAPANSDGQSRDDAAKRGTGTRPVEVDLQGYEKQLEEVIYKTKEQIKTLDDKIGTLSAERMDKLIAVERAEAALKAWKNYEPDV